jgi:hypothetical protein
MNKQPKCKHENTYAFPPDYDVIFCVDCGETVRLRCSACGGEGMVEAAEYEGDGVNCTDGLITCPECRGSGWVKEQR